MTNFQKMLVEMHRAASRQQRERLERLVSSALLEEKLSVVKESEDRGCQGGGRQS